MQLTEKLMKPIKETTYLTAENARRYRVILRFFYMQYEKIKYWMEQEEIYRELSSHEEFADYTVDQCRQDLDSLLGWGNLLTMQDTKRVTSIEAFKNRQYRYQLAEYSVEIERMTIRLEKLFVEGASLEPTLLEKIKSEMAKIFRISEGTPLEVYGWWNDLNNDFIRLNQNYQDYMRDLNSARAEELMKTTQFLTYKDKLIDYLRSFVKGLQLNVGMIENLMKQVTEEVAEQIFHKAVEYEMSIPRLDTELDPEELYEKAKGRFISMKEWFTECNGIPSEASRLFDMTNESIRKITRYATRISEQFTNGANRKEEYRKLCGTFLSCRDISEAHCLSAVVFGVERPLHLKGGMERTTDSINAGIYEEPACVMEIVPRVREYRERTERSHIREYGTEKEQARKEAMEKLKRERMMMDSFLKEGEIDFAMLPVLKQNTRNLLLRWLAKALEGSGTGKTEDGRVYRVENPDTKERCVVECEDGAFEMPAFVLKFEEAGNS
ncbi:TIGR02677 family protein [Clostridium sp. Marseille-P2415]|uniref:TIGR02677 family protein n=1 Tax=Clostridium sp. Marseille-P2415 TaxID=1805471 RepID=UPI00098841A3|nr:TIGR02677 family protein [Clostridium sp. Marseille-P2415]